MARPQKEGMDYFPHDTDAVNDDKVEMLRALYGNDGYAFFFILLERIYRTRDFELDVSDAETLQILRKKCGVTVDKFNKMLGTSLKIGAFCPKTYQNQKKITSDGIKKRAQAVVDKRARMRETYQNQQGVSDAETPAETRAETQQRKEKESIDNIYNNYPVDNHDGTYTLHDGSRARNYFGKWVDASDQNVTLDLGFYKELTK